MTTINLIKNIFDADITSEVHNAFTRYSLGTFEKEDFIIKRQAKAATVYTGFEYLNFLHRFLSTILKGEVEIEGVIESVRDQTTILNNLGITFEDKRRFGKSGSKYELTKQKISVGNYNQLVENSFGEFLLFNIKSEQASLKVKSKTTPKLGKPTDKFITIKMSFDILNPFLDIFLFDTKERSFKEAILSHTYTITDIKIDETLLAKDALKARKEAKRVGKLQRKVTLDGNVVKEEEISFEI